MLNFLYIFRFWLVNYDVSLLILHFPYLIALWAYALGCSFLVSMASLICLIFLPLIFGKLLYHHKCSFVLSSLSELPILLFSFSSRGINCKLFLIAVQGRPSKVVVDSLALFGVRFLNLFYLVKLFFSLSSRQQNIFQAFDVWTISSLWFQLLIFYFLHSL